MAVPIVYNNFTTPAIDAGNLNTVNSVVYTVIGDGTNAPATANDVRNNIGLGTMATQNANGVVITGGSISGISALPVASGGTGDTGTAWTSQAVTISSTVGTLGTATANLRYKIIGKTVFLSVVANITANGTGAGAITIGSLPFTFNAASQVLNGREAAIGGKALSGQCAGATFSIFNYDNTYPGSNGAILVISGAEELA